VKRHLRLDITHPALYPEVAELLRRLPLDILYHQKHLFRHPAAIYQLSLRQIAMDIARVLRSCAALRFGTGEGNLSEQLAQSQRTLIYSLREHLDDCQMILMCLVDPAMVTAKGNAPDEFLRATGLAERKLFWDPSRNPDPSPCRKRDHGRRLISTTRTTAGSTQPSRLIRTSPGSSI
jgi:hypothetical protein